MKTKMNPLTLVLLLSGLFFVIFLGVSAKLFLGKGKGGAQHGSAIFNEGAVAIVELNGVIMDSKKILARLERYEDSKEVKAIVLRLNTPGGAVAPSQEIYEAVKHYPKPVVVSMSSVAASGGYYIACAAKKVYANAGTITGSIGVIMEFANLSKLYEWAKVKRYSIKTGRYKDAGAEYRDMEPDERALLQGMVDNVLLQFKTAVSEGRKMTMEQVTAIADGRIFSGAQAKQAKLVDEIGTLQDAVNEAGKLAGIQGKPRIIEAEKHKKIWEMLMDERSSQEDDEDSQSQSGFFSKVFGSAVKESLGLPGVNSPRAPGIYWLWNGSY